MTQAVITHYLRSPFTLANKGELAGTRPDDLLATVVKAAAKNLNAEDIEDLIVGNAFPEGEQGFNIGRMTALLADLPLSVAGQTINRWCGSSMESVHSAAGKIALGSGELFIAAGVESMTRVPMGGFNPLPNPDLYERKPESYMSMGLTAEEVAKKYKISRKAQEDFAINSHKKAAAADLATEIVEVAGVSKDGAVRAEPDVEKMKSLKPAFLKKGSVTAATSSPVTDGAAVVVVASETYAKANNLPILAKIKATATTGLEPEIMGMGPVEASRKALARAGIEAKDLDIIELNEAFAAQALASISELGLDEAKVNIEGGAIALGHPLGASGARITGKAAYLLNKTGGKYALASMCIGGGMGIATVLEKP